MDRAENIKKYLDQEKEGKVAKDELISYCDKAQFSPCF